jgi:hypothetical protein
MSRAESNQGDPRRCRHGAWHGTRVPCCAAVVCDQCACPQSMRVCSSGLAWLWLRAGLPQRPASARSSHRSVSLANLGLRCAQAQLATLHPRAAACAATSGIDAHAAEHRRLEQCRRNKRHAAGVNHATLVPTDSSWYHFGDGRRRNLFLNPESLRSWRGHMCAWATSCTSSVDAFWYPRRVLEPRHDL